MRSIALIGAILVGAVGVPGSVAADCSSEGFGWPARGEAEGATFLALSTGTFTNDKGRRGYTMRVKRVYAGEVGDRIRVEMLCVHTKLKPGREFLISTARFRPADGREIHHVTFNDDYSVAWRVLPDRRVRILDYSRDEEQVPVPYLRTPDTLREAVRAVTPS